MSSDTPVRILVVDDNPATRYSTCRILRASGFEVSEAATGLEGVAKASEEIGLVVLDVNLPDIDGFEVCRRIRENSATARTPVLHLSATFVNDVDKVHGLDAGADGYLTHPVEPPVLVATINAFLRARRAELERERLLVSERAARDEAERANQLKDDFLATLSHELRTPLNAILGWAQVLERRPNVDADLREGLDAIRRNAVAQAQLIADLLDVSSIVSGKVVLELLQVDPSTFVAAALDAVVPAAIAKGINVERSLSANAGTILADAGRLQQVVWNLMNNAVKFTPRGGTIAIRVDRMDSHVEIEVSDNGRGISAEFLPHIFERFRQQDDATTRNHGGLGIGLAIVKHIVEMHGGTVTAHSDGQGQGAKFVIWLPVAALQTTTRRNDDTDKQVTRTEAAGANTSRRAFQDLRICVVDDDADSRDLLRRVLVESGAAVAVASNVPDALEQLATFMPHVLISDIGMPLQDGYDLIRLIRAGGQSAEDLPAIALTAFAGETDRDRVLAAGYQRHLAKPVEAAELLTAIDHLIAPNWRAQPAPA